MVVPVMMWLAGVCVLVVSYLATLSIQEYRRRRELAHSDAGFGYQTV